MGLQSALSTALTGLNAAETIIDVAGNNVANSQTVGFKESGVNFATQFLQTASIGSAPSAGSGGTNPRQIGLGVKVAEISQDFTQGTIEISSNPLDVAIQGDGFLIVQGGQGEQLFTRNGQLKTNKDNELVTIGGNRVLGYNAVDGTLVQALQPLVIPIGGSVVNRVTELAFFSGALDPQSAIGVGNIIESDVLSTSRYEVPDDFPASSFLPTPNISTSSISSAFSGTGTLPAGVYQYRFTFVDTDGNETAGSTPLTVDTTGPGGQITLDDFPTLAPGYSGINVYRTEAGGTTDFFKVNSSPLDGTVPLVDDTANGATLTGLPELDYDALDPGDYSYYVTFFNRDGSELESRPTKLEGPITVNSANQRIRITGIPQPTEGDFDEVRIYRSLRNDPSQHYRIAELDLGQEVYMDSVMDSEIDVDDESLRIDLDGPKITTDTLLTQVRQRSGSDFTPLFSGPGTLSFEAEKGDFTLPRKEFEVTAETTILEWMNFLQESLGINTEVPGAPTVTLQGGQIVLEGNKGLENAVQISASALVFTPTGSQSESINISFDETQQAVGEGSTSEFVVYDSLGIPLTVQLTTVLEEKNDSTTVWRWFATSSDNEPLSDYSTAVGTGLITYDVNGDFVENNADVEVIIDRNVTASQTLNFDLNFSASNGKDRNITQLDFDSQDGFSPGVLTDFSITETGEIRGIYSNGIGQTLGQIIMARFTNNTGLEQVGNNLFTEGVNSGTARTGIPGNSGLGALTAGAVELSNTDIGQNLIELILASTQYRGGARVITAVQELLDELLALRR